MPARLAFPFIYRYIAQRLDEDGRLRLDEILGDATAATRRETRDEQRRNDAVAISGFEVHR